MDDLIAKTPRLISAEESIATALTDKQMETLLARSAAGEGVMAILISMGIHPYAGTDWLKKHHHDDIVTAKREQVKNRVLRS